MVKLDPKDEGTEQERKIAKIVGHESYGDDGRSNDVCILQLAEPLELNDKVGPFNMPKQGEDWGAGTFAVVSGWGTLSPGGSSPDTLRAVTVPIVDREVCVEAYGDSVHLDMICSGEEGKDSCQGDSGGPHICLGSDPNSTDDDVHCGVVSWGRSCAAAGYPGVYAETSQFVDWIAKNSA